MRLHAVARTAAFRACSIDVIPTPARACSRSAAAMTRSSPSASRRPRHQTPAYAVFESLELRGRRRGCPFALPAVVKPSARLSVGIRIVQDEASLREAIARPRSSGRHPDRGVREGREIQVRCSTARRRAIEIVPRTSSTTTAAKYQSNTTRYLFRRPSRGAVRAACAMGAGCPPRARLRGGRARSCLGRRRARWLLEVTRCRA